MNDFLASEIIMDSTFWIALKIQTDGIIMDIYAYQKDKGTTLLDVADPEIRSGMFYEH